MQAPSIFGPDATTSQIRRKAIFQKALRNHLDDLDGLEYYAPIGYKTTILALKDRREFLEIAIRYSEHHPTLDKFAEYLADRASKALMAEICKMKLIGHGL